MKSLATDFNVHAEVSADIEGWVDVYQLQSASVLDLLSEGTCLERRKNQLVVAPDEFIGPALDLPTARVEPVELRLLL